MPAPADRLRSTRQDRTTHPTRPTSLGRPGHATTSYSAQTRLTDRHLPLGLLRGTRRRDTGYPLSPPPCVRPHLASLSAPLGPVSPRQQCEYPDPAESTSRRSPAHGCGLPRWDSQMITVTRRRPGERPLTAAPYSSVRLPDFSPKLFSRAASMPGCPTRVPVMSRSKEPFDVVSAARAG
jgi:hypothetical protein